jgi:glutathione S-transferase
VQLIGLLDSPFVRRVAITARLLGVPYEHRPLSIFRDYAAFREINPLVKVPTLVTDDNAVLVESTLIIDYLENVCAGGNSLMPADHATRVRALQIVGTSLVAMEKVVALIYERRNRPEALQHAPWSERVDQQLSAALQQLELFAAASGDAPSWLLGSDLTQADISLAVAWRFAVYTDVARVEPDNYPSLVAFSARAEALPEFIACPLG